MSPSSLLSKIDSQSEVHRYLKWHFDNRLPLRLMFDSSDGHLPAYIVGFDLSVGTMDVICMGVHAMQSRSKVSYAVIGSSASGARFLASGRMSADPVAPDSFKLSFPQWLDVSQSRDCYRCAAPSDHFLHFSSLDPHLNDIICRVRNVSLGGLAVEWESNAAAPRFAIGAETDAAILQSQEIRVHLGKLRVTHITNQENGLSIGLAFDRGVPKAFGTLVLDVQRTSYLLE